MPSRALILGILLAVFSIFFGMAMLWFTYSSWSTAYEGYRIEKDWHAPTTAYTARVIGFPIWGNGRRERIPTVRVTFADGRTAEFNSSRRSSYSEGDYVTVLTTKKEGKGLSPMGTVIPKEYDAYEIDDGYQLWSKYLLYGFFCLAMALFSPFWGFSRLRDRSNDTPSPETVAS
jgi:hypothetical protein